MNKLKVGVIFGGVSSEHDVVKEEIKYVRTSVTVYKNETESKIESFIKKGNKLEIIGYDYLDDEGNATEDSAYTDFIKNTGKKDNIVKTVQG